MIENPPYISDLTRQEASALLRSPKSAAITDAVEKCNNVYLYWSDMKYRAKAAGIEPEELWALIKAAREKSDIALDGFGNIHFSLSNSMQRLCHEFDMNLGSSGVASEMFPEDRHARELYLVSSMMEEAIASSQMEGAVTTREAAKEMLRRKISPKDKSQRMILNNYNTISFIREHVTEDLTPGLIMHIHAMMTQNALDVADAAGRFRRDNENIVVGNGITGETVHTPPPAACLQEFAERLCSFFNDRSPRLFIHPVIRAIIVHFLVGYYHPFADGNGRTARALFYWHMMRSGYRLVEYLSISRIIRNSKKAYEKAYLFSEHDGNDIGYFVQYNLEVLGKSFEELGKYIRRKDGEKRKSERLLRLGNVSPRQAEIITRFIDNPDLVITSMDVMSLSGVTANTAKADLKDLVRKEYLTEIALNGRTKGYIRSLRFSALTAP